MSSRIRRRRHDLSLVSSDHVRSDAVATQDKIRLLKQLVTELQRELESLNQVPTPAVEQGLDFYYEVSRFEIEMIRRALVFVGGHQGNAAQLLNLKETTLGAMIKRYCIQPGSLEQSAKRNDCEG